jgi:hypothetical protein
MAELIKTVVIMFGLVASVWAGVVTLDNRYEVQEVHDPVHAEITASMDSYAYTALKREIREIREAIWNIKEPVDLRRIQQLEWDLQDAIDRLCISFPNDRECK